MIAERLNLGSDYLSGSAEPMYIDIHCFPMLERLVMFENSPLHHGFETLKVKEVAPTIYAYVHRIKNHAILQKCAIRESENNRHLQYWLDNADKGKAQLSIDFLDD